jgi:hypothetical protein
MPGLDDLLISLAATLDDDLLAFAFRIYRDELVHGTILDHEGVRVSFHEDRFGHAFFEKKLDERGNEMLIKSRDIPSRPRIERIRWIAAMVSGRTPGTECWMKFGRRAYVYWSNPYIVWVTPKRDGGWKFSTAYPTNAKYIRETVRGGGMVWKYQEKK